MTKVLLNGKYVEPGEIDPGKHKFIGMFRPAENPFANPQGYIACTCGSILQVRGEEREHYLRGCYDIPQYTTMGETA